MMTAIQLNPSAAWPPAARRAVGYGTLYFVLLALTQFPEHLRVILKTGQFSTAREWLLVSAIGAVLIAGLLWLAERYFTDKPMTWRLAGVAILSSGITALVHDLVLTRAFGLPNWYMATRPNGADARALQSSIMFFSALGTAFLLVLIYYHREHYLETVRALGEAERKRAAVARMEMDARLQTLQAQVDPTLLRHTLARVETLYETDHVQANDMLDAFIAYLRATIPITRTGGATVESEGERLCAYVALRRLLDCPRLLLAIRAPEGMLSMPIPSMVLQPLIEQLCPLMDQLTMVWSETADQFEVLIEGDCGDRTAPATIQLDLSIERLRAVYGPLAAITTDYPAAHQLALRIRAPLSAQHASTAMIEPTP
jgi:hypothetical protein